MKTRSLALVTAVALVATGCFGGSSAKAPPSAASSTRPSSTPGVSSGTVPVLDPATRARLLAEYRAGRIRYDCPPGTLCPYYPPGVFWTGRALLAAMNRVNPTVQERQGSVLGDSQSPVVYVLADSTANRLDIATAAADGHYVHLVAVGKLPPQFEFFQFAAY
jgi:hypothetical protein